MPESPIFVCPVCDRSVKGVRDTQIPFKGDWIPIYRYPLHGGVGNRCKASGHKVKENA